MGLPGMPRTEAADRRAVEAGWGQEALEECARLFVEEGCGDDWVAGRFDALAVEGVPYREMAERYQKGAGS